MYIAWHETAVEKNIFWFQTVSRPLNDTVFMADSHLYRVKNTKCRIGTVFSPDDEHIIARNMYRKSINILRIIVHQIGSFYKIIQGCTVNKT
jgi:hypothetical protein